MRSSKQTDIVFIYPASALPINNEKIIVEIGPGRGDFLFHLAETNPDACVVGIEIKRKRVDKLIRRIERLGLTNIYIIQDDAREALPHFFCRRSVDEIHILFPDPWPKRRHEKNRAINATFLSACRDALKCGGLINFTTDHRPYADAVAQLFAAINGLESCYPEGIATNAAHAYPTFFAQKWIAAGREITYQRYRKDAPGSQTHT